MSGHKPAQEPHNLKMEALDDGINSGVIPFAMEHPTRKILRLTVRSAFEQRTTAFGFCGTIAIT